ncbi:MAG: phosphate ABC transporter ATP-binding protein PstB [Malacoplasma sp.]|nr:phosphate ABC transporter ATP-binding protein PstB [Malacoplasma sp.]
MSIKNSFNKLKNKILFKQNNDNKINEFKDDFNNENIFEIRNLNFWYENKKKQALFDINLDIKKHKVTSLIGPSGCGKSTFLRLLNRMNDLLPDTSVEGDIYFEKQNIYSKKVSFLDLRTKVGMVFQKATPFPMSIYDNVAFPLKNQGIRNKQIVDEIVEKSLKSAALWDDVKDNLNDLATGLSGGQQQRLCIARAIVCKPLVLLMDEPTSALDPIATSRIEELIIELKQKYTIIIVTHSMAQAQRISDETVFFFSGKIIESGPTKNIFLKPKEKKTRDYINGRIG